MELSNFRLALAASAALKVSVSGPMVWAVIKESSGPKFVYGPKLEGHGSPRDSGLRYSTLPPVPSPWLLLKVSTSSCLWLSCSTIFRAAFASAHCREGLYFVLGFRELRP